MISRFIIAAIVFSALSVACTHNAERPEAAAAPGQHAAAETAAAQPCVNLNRASAEELTQLPGIGLVMSRRIVEYRERHGPFRRPEEIIIIAGFSEKKFRALADRLCL